MAVAVPSRSTRWPPRRAASGRAADHRRRRRRSGDRQDARRDANRRHPLVDEVHGQGNRDEPGAVARIWRAFGLKPHLVDTFKLSPDPLFVDKVRDIVGLYINPPEGALVLCVDEKTQIQALDRTAPVLPLRPGLPERRTHDYVRHGTTNLYAALDVASGHVIADMTDRHRAEEFRRFLNLINRSVPEELDVHLVVDNVSTHKTPEIKRWLVRHPRFTLHFTPTYSSWINLVERWFAELTTKWLRGARIARPKNSRRPSPTGWTWNEDPKPFVWHKSADEILDTLAGYCERIS